MGIDIGSAFTKAVIVREGTIVSSAISPSGGNYKTAVEMTAGQALERAGLTTGDISGTAVTGYGSAAAGIPGRSYTDITCISRGVHHLFPKARTAVDIGSQYSRVIRLNEKGRNTDFLLSERCAGGSGRLLQTIAHVLGVKLEDIGRLSMKATSPVRFNTGCAVFAETEAISRVAEGETIEDILAGVNNALASKIGSLIERMGAEQDIVLTGGGAKDEGLVRSLQGLLGVAIFVPDEPQIVAAMGAAVTHSLQ